MTIAKTIINPILNINRYLSISHHKKQLKVCKLSVVS